LSPKLRLSRSGYATAGMRDRVSTDIRPRRKSSPAKAHLHSRPLLRGACIALLLCAAASPAGAETLLVSFPTSMISPRGRFSHRHEPTWEAFFSRP